jgi:hypothetical protein
MKKRFYKKWWFWGIIGILLISIISNSNNTSSTENETETIPIETPIVEKKNSPKISKAEFEQIKPGMTYEEIVLIVGGEGELSSEVSLGGIETKLYVWKGEGPLGANANMTFQNNSLVSKAQLNLK